MDVLIVLGDQDTYHENDAEIDSSPIWLSDILCAEGIVAQFVIHARRAEILAEFGRADTIRAMRRHEIGLHGRDVHPVLPELVEGLSWQAGLEAMRAAEGAELDRLGQVFDVTPTCSSQHRHQAAPQAFGLAAELGVPYLFGYPGAPPSYSVSWYAGALSVPLNTPTPESLCFFPAVFDDALPDDILFAELFGRLQAHVARCLEVQLPLLVVFVCHPERLCYSGPLEQWQYGNGANHGTAGVPRGVEKRRSRQQIDRALHNFRTVIRYLRDTPGLEPITTRQMTKRYGQQASHLSRRDLASVAREALETRRIPVGGTLSAADTVLGFAQAIAQRSETGSLPERVARVDALGPIEPPPLAPELPALSNSDLVVLAQSLVSQARATGHLPASLDVAGRRVGLGSLYGALAAAYHTDQVAAAHIALEAWPRYPEMGTALGNCHRLCTEDPLVRPGLSTDATALHAQLQTWTLKSATRVAPG
ncbi:MAG TPA: hypothetical protein VGL99_04795 [Chloroflexota bacterium]